VSPDGVARKPPDDGLQPERTSLAWTRTSFAVLGNGALLLVREFDHFPGALRLVPASLALVVALFIAGVGRWRQRLLHRRPLPAVVTAGWEIRAVGYTVLALIAVTAVTLPL
jgi:uncharacterized membrane protein YidH (DUF202 family)